jgi:hypothetical protein
MVPTTTAHNSSAACNQFARVHTVIRPAGASKSKLVVNRCVVNSTHILPSLHGRNAPAMSGMAQATPVVLK